MLYENEEDRKEEAVRILGEGAEKGNINCQNYLGNLVYRDRVKDISEAARLFKLAADQGDLSAETNLGLMYIHGDCVDEDVERGIKYLVRAADKRGAYAMYTLGEIYRIGGKVPQDIPRAYEYLERATAEGQKEAELCLAMLLYSPRYGRTDKPRAAEIFARLGTVNGLSFAQFMLGKMYLNGEVFAENKPEAARLFKLATKRGRADVRIQLESFKKLYESLTEKCEQTSAKFEQLRVHDVSIQLAKTGKELERLQNHMELENVLSEEKQENAGLDESMQSLQCHDDLRELYEKGKRDYKERSDDLSRIKALLQETEGEKGRLEKEGEKLENAKKGLEGEKAKLQEELEALRATIATTSTNYEEFEEAPSAKSTPENPTKDAKYFKIAADKGDTEATMEYARLLCTGDGVPKDFEEGEKYLRREIDRGNLAAYTRLGAFLIAEDESRAPEAVELTKYAAFGGFPLAHYLLAEWYATGIIGPPDHATSFQHLKAAADLGAIEAQVRYARLLAIGSEYVEKDVEKGQGLLRKFADKGHAYAQFLLADLLRSGDKEEKVEAIRFLRLAAENGQAQAQFRYGKMRYEGDGVPEDKQEGIKFYRLSAAQGNQYAQYYLGLALERGVGVDTNLKEAVKLYLESANSGFAVAITKVASMLLTGTGMDPDPEDAVTLFRRAADLQTPTAYYFLGQLYAEGEGGLEVDWAEAVRCLKKAIDLKGPPIATEVMTELMATTITQEDYAT